MLVPLIRRPALEATGQRAGGVDIISNDTLLVSISLLPGTYAYPHFKAM